VSEIEWRKLRADQLRELAKQDAMVIVPVGSLEQHGPHMPVEVDSQLGEQVANRTARLIDARGQKVVVLPMLWTGISEHHMSFGGTITLDLATFSAVIEGICRSLVRHGFTRIALLNAHGGNDNALRSLTDELTPKLGVPIVQFTYWDASAEAIGKILEKQPQVQHACEAETAMMMAVRPDLVAMDRIALAKANRTPDAQDIVGGGVYRWRTLGAMSASGVVGHPEAATAEKGERLFDGITRALADKLCNPELWQMQWQSERVG
jgi:creatinine amidohydrolase